MTLDPLALLERMDKHYLGGGRTLLWAPPHPAHLEAPGFWDEAHFLDYELPRLFTFTLLDEAGDEVPLRQQERVWRPHALTSAYAGPGITLTEAKACLADDCLAARVTLFNRRPEARRFTLILWSLQESGGSETIHDVAATGGALAYRRRLVKTVGSSRVATRTLAPLDLHVALGASLSPASHCAQVSETNAHLPRYDYTPFPERLAARGSLGDQVQAQGEGSDYLGLAYDLVVDPGSTVTINLGAAVATTRSAALEHLAGAVAGDLIARSEADWRDWFARAPRFTCSDEYLERYYYYRWYGLKLSAINSSEFNARHPGICEGIGMFRSPIAYAAQCHMRETRWLDRPDFAQGTLLNFTDNQLADGMFPGCIWSTHVKDWGLFNASWGPALLAVDAVHPDKAYLARVYESLGRYAEYMFRTRDREDWHLIDVLYQGETGQEYMRRYTEADPNADEWGDLTPRIKGVDVTVYQYDLCRSLAVVASRLGRADEAGQWAAKAAAIKDAVLTRMWNPDDEMFYDVNAATGEQIRVKVAVGFYPFLTDIADERHAGAIRRHLLNPAEFWLTYHVPSTSADDPSFNADAEWKGIRRSCTWNGRVWPMTQSHIAEVLARWAPEAAADFLHTFIRLMHFRQDPKRPNCFEHYHPVTGHGSVYRGVDDYMHSWVADLIIRFVAGVEPQEDGQLLIRPLPMGLQAFRLEGAPFRGHRVDVRYSAGEGLQVHVDGDLRATEPGLINLGED
jgi:hypothetical protein